MSALTHGQRENRIGRSAELAVLHCTAIAPWVTSSREATEDEDHRGIDVVFTTAFGEVPVQVKSSRMGARKHLSKCANVPVVVIYSGDPERVIRTKVRQALNRYLKKVVGIDPATGCAHES